VLAEIGHSQMRNRPPKICDDHAAAGISLATTFNNDALAKEAAN
jgi:hypothetical protein